LQACDAMEVLDMFNSTSDLYSTDELFDFGLDTGLADESDLLGYETCPYFTPPPSPPQQEQGRNGFCYLKQLIMPDTKNDQAFKSSSVQQVSVLPEDDCGYFPVSVKKEIPEQQQLNWEPELSSVSPMVEKKSSKFPSDAAKLKASRRTGTKNKKISCDKESEEYRMKRARNNIAVRKSRFKSKMKSVQTEHKVQELSDENKRLQSKVEYLTKELTVLRNLIASSNLQLK